MKKLLLVMALVTTACSSLLAQSRVVTGKVTASEDGTALPGVSVSLKGTSRGVTTTADGSYKISVDNGAALQFSFVGYKPQTITVGSQSTINVVLVTDAAELSEVVVTALGLTRTKNSLPYAAQQVKGDELTRVRSGNAFSALSGKVAGLQIIQGNAIGGSTNVVIRGNKSLTGNNQALFVVDGVPVDNTNKNTGNQQTGRGGYDYGNAAADINPDDIESMTVLKGAAATALYGSRASNGVIMITSKKAKKGLGLTVNAGLTVGTIDKSTFATYQNQYGAGYSDPYQKDGFLYFDANGDGTKDLVINTAEDASYGTKFNPSLMVYQWDSFDPAGPNYLKAKPYVAATNTPAKFYETAISNNVNVQLDGATDQGTFKLGYTRNDERGTLPNSNVTKNIMNLAGSYNISKKVTASAAANFSVIEGKGRYGSGYSGLNVNQNFRQWYQTNVDILEQKEAYFRNQQNVTWNWSDPSSAAGLKPIYTDNYYWTRYQNYQNDTRSRLFGNAMVNYKAADFLNFMGRVTVDTYNEFQEERIAVGSQGVPSYSRFDRTFQELNYDLMGNFDKEILTGLNLKALAGLNLRKSYIRSISASTNGGLIVPGLYSIANSRGTVSAPGENYNPREVFGVFGGLTLTYKDFLTLDGTIRQDKSSTLPVANNAYLYYAGSASWLFSHHIEDLPWLTSGKLRMNYATVGNDAPWGSIRNVYDKPDPFGSTILFSAPSTQNNPFLKPEQTQSKEIGLEMAFLQNRLGFDFTYYHTNTLDQILPASVSSATGFSSTFVNAGNIENKGFEVSLYASPIKTADFSWNVNVNWTKNSSLVLSLYNDSKNLQLATFQGGVSLNATVGQPYGILQGKTWKTLNGEKLVKANGRYDVTSTTTNNIGNVNPDWIGGINNSFKYKNVTLNFLIDMKRGGSVFSLDQYYGQATGVYPESVVINDKGNPSRSPIAEGGGVIMPGVKADGTPNTTRVENDYGTFGYAQNPAAAFVYDASYIKLREANIVYSLPSSVVRKLGGVKGVDLSIFGRNLWIIQKYVPYADPEENLSAGNIQGNQSGAYPTTRSIGFNIKLLF
ncbi:SusC/RagA family TonB-linked outer membrane protein [Aquirufa aurantiipilula]|uniref:SusC/RagA family TonB-linked outer membrane protein n=1 Tax=Aquirufa aurantiipilula TaxID=2696561 RepID=A0ABT6BG94_9BACT|nr:SusC/RagA family TonB-linked outer membrane protein [Aquirufa aurantiipilula]MBZ1327097.1 SusC/RagA family TonB-linked outer membrane protein [Aquirufa aurantiipilula]MDF5689337.1 SusC/RagA family TonB-linked outer membrane protein [Aquirufa aurantiipilula]